jgi:hypothetical protein
MFLINKFVQMKKFIKTREKIREKPDFLFCFLEGKREIGIP